MPATADQAFSLLKSFLSLIFLRNVCGWDMYAPCQIVAHRDSECYAVVAEVYY